MIKKKLLCLLIITIFSIPNDVLARENNSTVIPIEFFSNEPIVKMLLNGSPANLIVDLGTSGFDLTISNQILNESNAKLIKIDNKNFFVNYRRQKYPIKNYLITEATLGDFKFTNLSVIEFPGMSFFSDNPKQLSTVLNNGTIGIKLIQQFDVIFDYAHHKMVLIKNHAIPKDYKVDEWKKIPVYFASGNILTKGSVGKTPVRVILDTGNNALTMSRELANKIKSIHSNQYKQSTENSIICDLQFDNYYLKSQRFLIHNTHPEADISLGWGFFINHVVYFNFNDMYMAIK